MSEASNVYGVFGADLSLVPVQVRSGGRHEGILHERAGFGPARARHDERARTKAEPEASSLARVATLAEGRLH